MFVKHLTVKMSEIFVVPADMTEEQAREFLVDHLQEVLLKDSLNDIIDEISFSSAFFCTNNTEN